MTRRAPLDRTPPTAAGFTLTEIMIALAIVALLLVGISRIFSLTSTTIGSGQSLAKAMRSQKAIQTMLSNDFMGTGDLGRPDYESGMLPMVNTTDKKYAAPFFTISNFRVATYANKAAFDADTVQPADTTTMTTGVFRARSRAIRGIDLNNDGTENTSSAYTTTGGETIPIFSYGDRNFRTDSLNMFVRGSFTSQTGTTNFVDAASSTEAWVWYGHARIFNGTPTSEYMSNGYGVPGEWLTPTGTPLANTKNRFAEQFRLCRWAGLLIEPLDIKQLNTNLIGPTKANRNGVVANGDITQPIAFVKRNWWLPSETVTNSLNPIEFASGVYKFVPTGPNAGTNQVVTANGIVAGNSGASSVSGTAAMSITDVFGAGIKQIYERSVYVGTANPGPTAPNWRTAAAPVTALSRPWVNPFPATLTATPLAQRQLILSDYCSQFMVEFAGDFVTQNNAGAVTAYAADGVIDFAVVGGVRQTRFYGMPRDVDGDGHVFRNNYATSPDVVPLRDLTGNASVYNFEARVPPAPTSANDYSTNVDEPTSSVDSDDTSYVCAWGPADVVPNAAGFRAVPQLVRILVDVRDPGGRLKEAVTQEYVLPVRVTGAVLGPQQP